MKPRTVFLCFVIVFGGLPFFASRVHAAPTWQCNPAVTYCSLSNQYAAQCLLSTTGDNSTSVDTGLGFGPQDQAFSSRGTNCDGVGYLSAYTVAGSPYGNTNSHSRIVFTDTFTISNYGQTSTVLNIGADYILAGYLYTTGLGALMSSSSEIDVRFNMTGPGVNKSFMQNNGLPWRGASCYSTIASDLTNWPPFLPYCQETYISLNSGDSYFNLNNFDASPGTWTLSMIVETNATAYASGYSGATGGACFAYSPKLGCYGPISGQCSILLGCRPQPPSPPTNCPPPLASPCFYSQWVKATYSINLSYSGSPDFIVSIGSPSRSSLLDNYYGATAPIQVQSINGFAGNVNLYYGMSPFQSVTPPNAYMKDSSGNLVANGTSYWVSPSSPLSLTFYVDPCAKPSTQSYCTNGYCASNPQSSSCGSNYQTTPPATPGRYLFEIQGVSGTLTREAVLNLPIRYYDLVVRNVASSYSGGILTVNATVENMGDTSPLAYGFSAPWGETISYYLDGTLQSTVNLCGQPNGFFLFPDCPSGQMFNHVWHTPTTTAVHNSTVTASEIVAIPTTLIDRSNSVASDSAGSSNTVNISTTQPNDLIVVWANLNGIDPVASSSPVTDTRGLVWTQRAAIGFNSGNGYSYEYYAIAPSILSNDQITVSASGSENQGVSIIVFAVTGVSATGPFDTESGIPVAIKTEINPYFFGTITTTVNGAILLSSISSCCGALVGLSPNPGVLITEGHAGYEDLASGYYFQSSSGSQKMYWGEAGTAPWEMVMDALCPVGGCAVSGNAPIYGTLGDFFDITSNNDKLDADFRLVPQSTSSTVYATQGSSISTLLTTAAFPDFYGTVSISGSAPSGWGLSFNATSVTLNPNQDKNVTATISVPSSTVSGNYSVTFTGAGPFSTHSIKVIVQVSGFSISANPTSVSIQQGNFGLSTISFASFGGWSGFVILNSSSTVSGINMFPMPENLTLASGGNVKTSPSIGVTCSVSTGTYPNALNITGASGSIIHSVIISVTVTSYSCNGGSGGGGSGGASLGYGTLVTMIDGKTRPVQNLNVGDQLLGFNTTTGQYVTSTVISIVVKNATNMLVFNTRTGTPLRVDASLTEVLWTRLLNGTALWLPAPYEQVGFDLWTQNGWVAITSINYAAAGNHTMWDVTATAPYFASGYLDPPHPS